MKNLWGKKWFKATIIIFSISIIIIPTIISLNKFLSPSFEFIEITNAKQFKRKYHFSGAGHYRDPYIIENMVINTSNSFGIRIADLFFCNFIIRNCTIIAKDYAIIFSNFFECQASIINCTFSSNNLEDSILDSSCINLLGANSIEIANNTFTGFNYGIYTSFTTCKIINNTFFDNSISNIKFDHKYTDIINNTFTNNSDFPCIEYFNSIPPDIDSINPGYYKTTFEFRGNIFEFCKIGIKITNWDGAVIEGNQFRNSTFGILLINSTAHIWGNQLLNCTNGIIVNSCNDVGIFNNLFEDNKEYAIIINGTTLLPNKIDSNDFINNIWSFDTNPLLSQVYDSTNNSLWYEPTYELGNYWSDLSWTPTSVYLINGGNCTDIYPLEQPYIP